MKKLTLTTLLYLLSISANANSGNHSGKVSGYIASGSGDTELFYFNLEANPTGSCNTSARFSISSASSMFKSVQSTVMAAYHSKESVNVFYNETCNSAPNAWDIEWVCVGTIPC